MKNYKELLTTFFRIFPSDVYSVFADAAGIKYDDTEEEMPPYFFIPGTRDPKERVLLVAHVDTAHNKPPKKVHWRGNFAMADFEGLGADDRAGCAMLYELVSSGHSILLTDGEEAGCIGAQIATEEIPDLLSEHAFAVEIDRAGDMEFVEYGLATKEFMEFLRNALPGWREPQGSFTDISAICPSANIGGVNLAAGYMFEHSSRELLSLDAWLRTREALHKLLFETAIEPFPVNKDNRSWWLFNDDPFDKIDICDEISLEKYEYEFLNGNKYTSQKKNKKKNKRKIRRGIHFD